ncbi:MAG: hypothetical protein J0651_04020, partial [Actinobacteria bacterium]|nr:hypothetical protein [Actinomycetota bacterium]
LWWTSVLEVDMEYVRVEEVGGGEEAMGLSMQTDLLNRIKLCEFTAKRTECSGNMEVSGWSRIRLSHCGGQVSLCIDNSQGSHCVRMQSELFGLGGVLKQQVSPILTGREVQWQCIPAESPRALLSFGAPRRLASTHYAGWMISRTIPANGDHYYSFVNTHVGTTSLTLTVVRTDGII